MKAEGTLSGGVLDRLPITDADLAGPASHLLGEFIHPLEDAKRTVDNVNMRHVDIVNMMETKNGNGFDHRGTQRSWPR